MPLARLSPSFAASLRYPFSHLLLAAGLGILAGCSRPAASDGAPPGASPAAAPVPAARPFPITVQLDWVAEPEHGGFYQALARGFFRDAGLDVTIDQGGPNGFVLQKVATGQADIGQSDSTTVLTVQAQGTPVVQIGAVFQNDPSVLMLHPGSPVRRFEDLEGKTLIARPEWAFLPYLKQKYHINFSVVPQNFSVALFVADRTSIQQGYYIAEPYYIVQGGGEYPRFLYAWDAGFDAYGVLVANREWAVRNRERVRAFMAAYIHGWRDYLEGDPAPAQALMKRLNPHNTDDFLAFSRKMIIEGKLVTGRTAAGDADVGRISPARIATQIRQLESLGILPAGKVTADQAMTTDYLP